MWFAIIIIAIFAAIAAYNRHSKNIRRKAQHIDEIPGPKAYPLIGNIFNLIGLTPKEMPDYFQKLRKRYGTIFRIWFGPVPIVVVSNPKDMEVLLHSQAALTKAMYYDFFRSWLGNGLIVATGSTWHEKRKLFNITFHTDVLKKFIPTIFEKSESFAEGLSDMLNKEKFDIYPDITNLGMQIVCETIMGIEFDLRDGESLKYMKSVHDILEAVLEKIFKPHMWIPFVYWFTKNYKKEKNALHVLQSMTIKVIEKKKSERIAKQNGVELEEKGESEESNHSSRLKLRKALLDFLFDELENSGLDMTAEDIQYEVNNFILAGSETTSVTMAILTHFLGHNPSIQERMFEEIRTALGDSDACPTLSDLSQLQFCDKVIKETLRITPPASFIGRTTTGDIELEKYKIPAGTQVILDIDGVHKDETYFKNPSEFDPEHFSTEQIGARNPYTFLAFSASHRNCIGQRLAIMEIKIFLFSLLRRYKIESKQTFEELGIEVTAVAQPRNGVQVSITPRSQTN